LEKLNDLVSVVIPVYNSEKFLSEAIESVLNQTYQNIAILAIDDGSTDDSLKILKKYYNKIKIISQKNQGLARSLNTALKEISGKWFKWMSPDDVLYPEAIYELVNQAKKLSVNSIVYSNWELIDENNKKLRDFEESNYNDLTNFEFNVRLLDGQQINVNTSLIPVTLFQQGCKIQDVEDPVAIDYDFFLRAAILYNASFYLIPKSLLKYRIHKKQLSHKNISNTLNYISKVRTQILSNLDTSKKEQYTTALKEYQKKMPLLKKTMKFGLDVTSKTFPTYVTDRLITFYLNKIRRTR